MQHCVDGMTFGMLVWIGHIVCQSFCVLRLWNTRLLLEKKYKKRELNINAIIIIIIIIIIITIIIVIIISCTELNWDMFALNLCVR